MSLRFFTYGRWRGGPQHSWPALTAVDVVEDEAPHNVTHRWYQLSWFGMTLNLDIPTRNRRSCLFLNSYDILDALCRMLS